MSRPTEGTIGTRVREARERSGRPQRTIATSMTMLGHKWIQDTMTRVENGKRPLRLSEAVTLADILGVSLESLYRDQPTTAKDTAAIRELLGLQTEIAKRIRELS